MPLLPMFTNDPWYYYHHRPSRLANQHFGNGLKHEELLKPLTLNSADKTISNYFRQWTTSTHNEDAGSIIHSTNDYFEITLDVKQFAPEEITVKTIDNSVIVEGKHEEKEDDHGLISRQFIRKYPLPNGYDVDRIVSQLHSDGILTITIPKVSKEEEHRHVEIEHTGQPSKTS